jgi:hypothetical protein
MSQPTLARPIFSSEDFKLLKRAVHAYLVEHADEPESSKYSHLYHRLGRAGR